MACLIFIIGRCALNLSVVLGRVSFGSEFLVGLSNGVL